MARGALSTRLQGGYSLIYFKPKRINTVENGTAAPAVHLSDTLNWSCFSARIKNQAIILPAYDVIYRETEVPKDDLVENTVTKSNDE